MLKKIDKLIAIIMVIMVFALLFNKFISKLIMITTIILILKILLEKKIKAIIIILISTIIVIYNYIISKEYFYLELTYLDKYFNREYGFKIILFLSMAYIFSNKAMIKGIYEEIRKYINIVIGMVGVYELIILLSIIRGNGFLDQWGMTVFVGLNGSAHGNAYLMILLSVIIEWIIVEKNNNKFLLFYIIPFVTAFISGARTPALLW